MPGLNIVEIMLRELLTTATAARAPEPRLIMDDKTQVDAYLRAGREGGSLAPLYLFHSAQICSLIRSGDLVLDLACGPANQLGQVARLNPESRFIGVDLSPNMLALGRRLSTEDGLSNIEFKQGDITHLADFDDRSVDVVISTLSLHHLPDIAALNTAFREAGRVLKPGGAVYFADLGHLRSEQSIKQFARQYADQQPEVFTLDYLNSMRAAFSLRDLREAARVFGPRVSVLSTFLVPYMVIVKSPPRGEPDRLVRERLNELRRSLPPHQQSDLKNLRWFFRLGGLRSPNLE